MKRSQDGLQFFCSFHIIRGAPKGATPKKELNHSLRICM